MTALEPATTTVLEASGCRACGSTDLGELAWRTVITTSGTCSVILCDACISADNASQGDD